MAAAVGVSAAAISTQPSAVRPAAAQTTSGTAPEVMSRTPLISVSLPSGLAFAADDTPGPLERAFSGIRDAFPDADGTRAEAAWSALHGLATLQASGRLRASQAQARLDLAHCMLTQQETR